MENSRDPKHQIVKNETDNFKNSRINVENPVNIVCNFGESGENVGASIMLKTFGNEQKKRIFCVF